MLGKGQRKEHARLLTRVGMCAGKKCSQMCQRALTQKRTLGAAAHPRLSIFVCGRISTSLSRPDMSEPLLVRLLLPKLQARGGVGAVRHQECQRALTQKRTLWSRFE